MDAIDQTNEGVLDENLSSEPRNEIKNPSHTHPLMFCDVEHYGSCCLICREEVSHKYYRCLPCWFVLCLTCVRKPFVVNPLRSHEHTLSLVPKSTLVFTCHACGVGHQDSSLCLCIPCCFTIHWKCVALPRVICINRHEEHRISHVSSVEPKKGGLICKVCREEVDWRYGSYSCSTCSNYVVHSKCATSPSVWDQIELEGVPEEDPQEIMPFQVVGEGVIKYFSHEHNLRLDEDVHHDKIFNKQCKACINPIYSNPCYICTHDDCDFVLHEVCANFLRKRRHPSHAHRLTLKTGAIKHPREASFECNCRGQESNGFAYVGRTFYIDVRCASILEGCVHKSHPHPLYFNLDSDKEYCSGCKRWNSLMIECAECEDFGLCLKCATLPDVVNHKYDKHPISLCYSENHPPGVYWCEICEKRLDPEKWFYTCGECGSTLHTHCVLGENPYIRLGAYKDHFGVEFEVVPNSYTFWPKCHSCPSRSHSILRHEDDSRNMAPFLCHGPNVITSQNLFFCSSLCLNIKHGRY